MELIEKHLKNLEDDVQCPVCFELPTDSVQMCVMGHHVCKSCTRLYLNRDLNRNANCPTCKSAFNGTTTYVIKNICSSIEQIRESLFDFIISRSLDEFKTDEKVSVATQTSFESQDKSFPKINLSIKRNKYSCQIRSCYKRFTKAEILQHIRRYHIPHFIEEENKSKIFNYCWIIERSIDKSFDRAINIIGMGLFFFNFVIHEHGHIYGSIQMANPGNKAQRFSYIVIFICGKRSLQIKGKVDSCQSFGGSDLQDKMNFFLRSAQLSILLKNEGVFKCNLTLHKRGRKRCIESSGTCENQIRLNKPTDSFLYKIISIIIIILLSFSLRIFNLVF